MMSIRDPFVDSFSWTYGLKNWQVKHLHMETEIYNWLVRTTPHLIAILCSENLGSGKWSSRLLMNAHHDQHSPDKSMVVSGSPKRWAWWHIIPHLAGKIPLIYIPRIVLAEPGG